MTGKRTLDHAAVVAAFDAGEKSCVRLAEQFRTRRATVRRILINHRRNPPDQRGGPRKFDYAAMLREFDAGERNPTVLARQFGVHRMTIRGVLIRSGRVPRGFKDPEYRMEVSERMCGNRHAALVREGE